MNREVLVLNQNYEPLNITNLKRAIVMVYLGKAQTLKTNSDFINSVSVSFEVPAVIRLSYFVKRPFPELKLSRKNILARDNYTCQYCGSRDGGLTIDHVVPKNKGGKTEWQNLVCCCIKCNIKKADKTLEEASVRLLRPPKKPKYVPYISLTKLVSACKNETWREYLQPYIKALDFYEA